MTDDERKRAEKVAEEWLFGGFLAAMTRESEIRETADLIQNERAAARAEALASAAAVVGFEAAHANIEYMESGDDWDKNMRDWLLRIEDRIRALAKAGEP